MRKAVVLAIIASFVLVFSTSLHAAELPRPVDKLVHGFGDIITSPLEIYHHTSGEVNSASVKPWGFIKGLLESPFYVIKKGGGGLIDVLTFPIE